MVNLLFHVIASNINHKLIAVVLFLSFSKYYQLHIHNNNYINVVLCAMEKIKKNYFRLLKTTNVRERDENHFTRQ